MTRFSFLLWVGVVRAPTHLHLFRDQKMAQYNFSIASGSIASVGTSFDVNKKVSVTLSHSSSKYFLGRVGTLQFKLSDISSATTIEFKMTADATGNDIIIQNTTGSIDTGLTTTTVGSVGIDIDALLYCETETFYIFPKVDAGSCTVTSVSVTYESND